jgi:DNA-directed RNA polymerase subunit RPC12/RpoP
MSQTCPGLNSLLRPKPEFIKCPRCGGDIEIWTDETEAECPDCKLKVSRKTQSCLEYCEYADTCRQIVAEKKTSRGKTDED